MYHWVPFCLWVPFCHWVPFCGPIMRSHSAVPFRQVEVGKFADLVLWKPALFGAKPEMTLKGGTIAWAQMGDPNASIPTPQPVVMRQMFGALGKAVGNTSIAFVSAAAATADVGTAYGLTKHVEAVKGTRTVSKHDMVHNNALPVITVRY